MRVLVACEESQRVCISFRDKGHEAYSCDIIECSGDHPEWHIKDDVLKVINGNCTFLTQDNTEHKIDGNWDLIIAHPPCFTADTKVITFDGVKSIQDVKIGDLVLTHKRRYKKVTDVMVKKTNKIAVVHTENCGYIKCTPNHPFYVSNVTKINGSRRINPFEWVPPEDFKAVKNERGYKCKTYITSVSDETKEYLDYEGALIGLNSFSKTLKNTLDTKSKNFWYIAGRWLGDGWFYYQYQSSKRLAGIKICCSKKETEYLKNRIEQAGFTYFLSHEKTTDRFEIANKELGLFMEQFGKGALNKHIPGFVTRLPDDLALSFIEGYLDADGYKNSKDTYSCNSISADLIYGLKYMINKYYKVACSVSYNSGERGRIIEGRECNVHPQYVLTFRKGIRKQSHYLIKDNYILAPFIDVKIENNEETVYNLSVEDDESYTANGIVVHNCTHLSASGSRHFDIKRADGRQREAIEFFCKMLHAQAERIVVENPVGIIGGKYIMQYFPDLCEKYGLPLKPTQKIQPYEYGEPYIKTTCLWIKGLPKLQPTNILEKPKEGWVNQSFTPDGRYGGFNSKFAGSKERSKTFWGIARAMADQWG